MIMLCDTWLTISEPQTQVIQLKIHLSDHHQAITGESVFFPMHHLRTDKEVK